MSTSKFRIKMGEIEVEYDGSDDFLKKELPDLLAAVSKLHKESAAVARTAQPPSMVKASESPHDGKTLQGTTATFASKLGVTKGGELVIAAAAQLKFVEGKDSFTRDQLIAACREGKSYFKKSYVGNLSNYLSRLVASGQLNEISSDEYALSAKELKAVEAKLATE